LSTSVAGFLGLLTVAIALALYEHAYIFSGAFSQYLSLLCIVAGLAT
jgi:hypothetical protein